MRILTQGLLQRLRDIARGDAHEWVVDFAQGDGIGAELLARKLVKLSLPCRECERDPDLLASQLPIHPLVTDLGRTAMTIGVCHG
jgi:hypothetical protein